MQIGPPSTRPHPPANPPPQSPPPRPAPSPSWTAAYKVIICTCLNLKEFKSYYHLIPAEHTSPKQFGFWDVTNVPTLRRQIQHMPKVLPYWRQWGEWRLYTVAPLEFPNSSVSRQKPGGCCRRSSFDSLSSSPSISFVWTSMQEERRSTILLSIDTDKHICLNWSCSCGAWWWSWWGSGEGCLGGRGIITVVSDAQSGPVNSPPRIGIQKMWVLHRD